MAATGTTVTLAAAVIRLRPETDLRAQTETLTTRHTRTTTSTTTIGEEEGVWEISGTLRFRIMSSSLLTGPPPPAVAAGESN